MYPNTHDVLPLPARAGLDRYLTDAEDLVEACKAGAIGRWASRWPDYVDQIQRFAADALNGGGCAATAAQFVIARVHGFESWPTFAAHLEDLACAGSPTSRFETAADAIVNGDSAALQQLLREHPDLIRARSSRGHRATLLHYAAANGVENYRQQTPGDVVAIAGILLDAGAEVNAEAEMYGGRCTTLGLAATSVHPERAGVQNALMQSLIDRGASVDHPAGAGPSHSLVASCLANGRAAAAEYLAANGARLDLDGAAGIGRLDLVAGFFNPDGTLKPTATIEQLRAAMNWACEHGRNEVVQFLLDRGVLAKAPSPANGRTFLHSAAIGGRAAVVQLLIARSAPVDVVESTYDGTPLQWALHGWSEAATGAGRDRYAQVVALLVRAGAAVNPAWLDEAAEPTPFRKMLRADASMIAALRSNPGTLEP
jgi:ankyrin repeat protein